MSLEPVQRSDISRSVIHLTRERIHFARQPNGLGGRVSQTSAFDVLKEIIKSGVLRGSGNEGFVKGKQRAVCFSEIPLSSVRDFASPPSDTEAKYRYYGIALSKQTVFEAGGRPVIYLPDAEADWIPDEHKWRQVRYEFGKVDWTHEREWRLPGDLDLTKVRGLYVIVWSTSEASEILSMESPVKDVIRGILPMQHLTMML